MIKTGNRNFWIAQLVGWTLTALSNIIVQYTAGYSTFFLITNSLIPFTFGFLITTAHRYFIKQQEWKKWTLPNVLLLITGSTIALTIIFMICIGLVFSWLLNETLSLSSILSNSIVFGFIFLCWNLIYFFIHYFNNWHFAEIEKWKLIAEKKDAQLGSLKAQINPHFVFNAINNIRALILEDPSKARDMLLNFSDLFRYALQHSEKSTVLLKDEVEIVEQYLELLSIQFEEKLSYSLELDDDLEGLKIPPMMLQLLVENAVKHGTALIKEGGTIAISIYRGNGFLNVDVKNTGNLKQSETLGQRLGVGLENIRKRLDLIYNGKADFKLQEKNNFVTASLKIPVI